MRVYFVRHGESEANVKRVYGGETSSLTVHGIRQADTVANRFQSIDIDVIISSSMTRARETAEAIRKVIKKEIAPSDLFVERRYPSELIGRPEYAPEEKRFYKELHENMHNPDWRFSDEENFNDLKYRAQKAWKFIEQRSEENILVTTHGDFLRYLVLTLLLGDRLDPEAHHGGPGRLWTSNTGITLCEKVAEDPRWRLVTWNDHTHLG